MTDYLTSAPAAGWYTDPSNPSQERWWGGVEWTHDVRPIAATPAMQTFPQAQTAPAMQTFPPAQTAPAIQPTPPPLTQPVSLASVPGGGINPFAAIDAEEASRNAYAYGGPAAAAPDFSSFNSFGAAAPTNSFGAVAPTSTAPASAVSASWYDPGRRAMAGPPPSNGFATAGLILSLVGVNLLGIIFSIVGLRKARGFEADGELPVGRKRSRWGLGLGIASVIISGALLALWLVAGTYLYGLYLAQTGSTQSQSLEPTDGFIVNPDAADPILTENAGDGTYLRADYEQAIRDEYAEDGYTAPDSVVCPDAGSTSAGSTIVCTITVGDIVQTRTTEYTDGGYLTTTTIN